MTRLIAILFFAVALAAGSAWAQGIPVIDQATLTQATQTASNTASIMNTSQQTMQITQQTLDAVTGSRSTGTLSNVALGFGFTVTGAPDFSSLLSSGQMSWGNLGSYGSVAANIINGFNLSTNLTGLSGSKLATDQTYAGAVNTAAAVQGLIGGARDASNSRSSALTTAAGTIGSTTDIKASIDANSQLQVQTGQMINELIGIINAQNAVINAQNLQDLSSQSKLSQVMTYDANAAVLVK